MKKASLLICLLELLATLVFSQPTVNEDLTVEFSLKAPQATEVALSSWYITREEESQGEPTQRMKRDEHGTWKLTTGPFTPGNIVEYAFIVDGVRVLDAENPTRKNFRHSALPIPAEEALPWLAREEVPRGTIHTHSYLSDITHTRREFVVYTPPGYEQARGKKEYPLLYLLHGAGGHAHSWTNITGSAHIIADNLIEEGAIEPVIIVMPQGHIKGLKGWAQEGAVPFIKDLHMTVVPMMEELYAVKKGRENRTLAGLSMGGYQTLHSMFNYPGAFEGYGVFSASNFGKGKEDQFKEEINAISPNARPDFVFLACGTKDDDARMRIYTGAQQLYHNFKSAGYAVEFHSDDSGHTWDAWRKYLPLYLTYCYGR